MFRSQEMLQPSRKKSKNHRFFYAITECRLMQTIAVAYRRCAPQYRGGGWGRIPNGKRRHADMERTSMMRFNREDLLPALAGSHPSRCRRGSCWRFYGICRKSRRWICARAITGESPCAAETRSSRWPRCRRTISLSCPWKQRTPWEPAGRRRSGEP